MEQLTAALAARLDANASAGVLQLLQAAQGVVRPLDVHIASPGGVGSTSLSNFLTRHGCTTNLLTDTDGFRHSPQPPAWCLPGASTQPHPGKPRQVLYLYGDPYEVVCSHYRRGHAYHQALKTCGSLVNIGPKTIFPATAEQYFAQGQDLFGLEAHFHSWQRGALAYPVLLLRYESMFEPQVALPLFQALCGHRLNEEQVKQMAQEWVHSKHTRASQVPPLARDSGMYDSLCSHMNHLPPLMMVPPRSLIDTPPQQQVSAASLQQAMEQLSGVAGPH